jgi:hypothetical protein
VTGPVLPPQHEEHGPIARLLLLLVGLLFVVGGAILFGIAVWTLLMGRGWKMRALAVPLLALFGAIAIYGSHLLRRGLKGWSQVGALDRANARFQRGMAEWLPAIGFFLGTAVWLLTRGRIFEPGAIWYLIVSFALFPLSAAIHELGHLLPGLAQGRTLWAIRIWPLTFRRSDSGKLVGVPGLRITDGFGGFVQWSGSRDHGRVAELVMRAGGVVSNVAATVVLIVVAGRVGQMLPPVVVPLLLAAALSNGMMAVGNLLPTWRNSVALNDGAQIWRALGPGHRASALRDRVLGEGFVRRPRDWAVSSRELTDEATPYPADRAWLLLMALGVSLDRGDRMECERVLALQAQERFTPPDVQMEFGLQRALMHSLLDGNVDAARAELAKSGSARPEYAALAAAGTLLAEGHPAEAARAFGEWTRAASRTPGWIIGNQWAVDRIEQALQGVETPDERAG